MTKNGERVREDRQGEGGGQRNERTSTRIY